MARILAEDHSNAGGETSPADLNNIETYAQNIVISPTGEDSVPIPGQGFISNAVMTQDGSDLVLETPDGITLVIEGYFSGDTPPNLVAPDGKILTPALVKSFIQAGNEYAEEPSLAMNDATPVGEVHEVSGSATVTHVNGSKETIAKGTPIYEGDVIETDAKGAVNIQFADESSFAVSNNAKMAIDEFVFDTQTNGGENKFSMLRGLFVYTSGLVGREDPDDVQINTPVGSIGIRGTIITGDIPADGANRPAQISVVEGAIVVHSNTGTEVTLSQQFETVQIDSSSGTMNNIGVLPQSDFAETFNVLRTVAPTLFSSMEEAQQEGTPSDAPADATAQPVEAAPDAAQPDSTAPADTPATVEPQSGELINLNLLQDHINSDTLKQSVLQDAPTTTAEIVTTVAPQSAATSLPVAPVISAPVVTTSAASVGEVAYQPTGTTTANPTTTTPPVNLAPVTAMSNHAAIEAGGIVGSSHQFDASRFFKDPEGSSLTYTVAAGTNVAASIDSFSIDANGRISYAVKTALAADTNFTLTVTASDGVNTSTPLTLQFFVYKNVTNYSNDDDTGLMLATNGSRHNLQGGNDDATIVAANFVYVWAGSGEDSITVSGSDNKVFGEEGTDTITIMDGGNHMVSGGFGDDIISSNSSGNVALYGGYGDDRFSLNANAVAALQANQSLIDGGNGFDTLSVVGNLNLTTIANTTLIDIDKIYMASTGPATLTLDLQDILQHTSTRALYLDVDGNDTIIVNNTTGMGNLIQESGTYYDPSGVAYNKFSNGNVSLYIDASATAGNISGSAF